MVTPVTVTLVVFIATVFSISGIYVLQLGISRLALHSRPARPPR